MTEPVNDLWCIVLLSTAVKEITAEHLKDIFETVRQSRKAKGITGLTVYSVGNVLSLIEGKKQDVLDEYKFTISHSAHHSITKLYDGKITYRSFEGQELAAKIISPEAFRSLDTFETEDQIEYFSEFLDTDHIIPRIVSDFIKNNK